MNSDLGNWIYLSGESFNSESKLFSILSVFLNFLNIDRLFWFLIRPNSKTANIIFILSLFIQKKYSTILTKRNLNKLCNKLNFHHTIKWYMLKAEAGLENETHEILWDFERQINHKTRAKISSLALINNLRSKGFCFSCWPQSKNERRWNAGRITWALLLEQSQRT